MHNCSVDGLCQAVLAADFAESDTAGARNVFCHMSVQPGHVVPVVVIKPVEPSQCIVMT